MVMQPYNERALELVPHIQNIGPASEIAKIKWRHLSLQDSQDIIPLAPDCRCYMICSFDIHTQH